MLQSSAMLERPPVEKRTALAQPIENMTHRLFYQARNLAIEAMLLRVSDTLLRQGFNVRCQWLESSFGGATVSIRMYNRKPGSWEYGSCRLHLGRERISAPEHVSDCFYSLKEVVTTEHWGAKQPQQLLDFRAAVARMAEEGRFEQEIARLNYPFDYESHSPY